MPPCWHSWNTLSETILQRAVRPVQVVGRLLPLVSRPGSKGSSLKRWSAGHIGGLPSECNSVVVLETKKCGSKVRETTYLSRKSDRLGKGGLQEEKVVSHPCTTFLTMKLGSMPKMNQDGCKTRVRGAKTRNQVPRKLTVKHQRWRVTTKVVARAIVSL